MVWARPTGLTATPETAVVRLTWAPPASDGGSHITGYRVYRDGTLIASPVAEHHTDLALSFGRVYSYEVSAVTGLGEGPKSVAVQATPMGEYVALGDSYSSGEGAIDGNGDAGFESGTDLADQNECHRSRNAYPHRVQASREAIDGDMRFQACSGAQTVHFVADLPGPGQWREGPQLDAIAPAGEEAPWVSLVTLTVGGNDVGFGEVLSKCVSGFPHYTSYSDCRSMLNRRLSDGAALLTHGGRIRFKPGAGTRPARWRFCGSNDRLCASPPSGEYVVTVPSLRRLYERIHRRAPNAAIRVLGYPRLFPPNATTSCRVGSFRSLSGITHRYYLTVSEMGLLVQQGATSTPSSGSRSPSPTEGACRSPSFQSPATAGTDRASPAPGGSTR